MPLAGILRQIVGKVTESKNTGEAFEEELNHELSPENIIKEKDGDCYKK